MKRAMFHRATAAVILLGGLSSVCSAGLAWKEKQFEKEASASDNQAVAEFTFTNKGKNPVTIQSVVPSCGCTTAKLEKTTYAPGESGKIVATFDFGTRTGLEVKTIRVVTDDPKAPEAHLTMRVRIPQVVKITPVFVFWKHDEEKTTKPIEVQFTQEVPIHIKAVAMDGEGFVAKLQAIDEGRHYRILVTPQDEQARKPEAVEEDPLAKLLQPSHEGHDQGVKLTIQTDYPKDKPRTFEVFARILPQQAAPEPLTPLAGPRGGRLLTLPVPPGSPGAPAGPVQRQPAAK